MKVFWTRSALGHLTGIYDHIAQDSPHFARRMVDRITSRSQQVATFPYSGQMVPEYQEPDIREVIEGSYRIIYLVRSDDIRVLAVIHGAQSLPAEPPTASAD